ncbi:MAG: Uma2 family endonuclease [Acidobacteria bacterium]|nr:Uma2 family endonuclease [Acidobacteriota bacterium]
MTVQAAPAESAPLATDESNAPAAVHRLSLENGDRLTRREFERRYATRPDIKKAELIEGVVYVSAAVRLTSHAEPHSVALTWLGNYCAHTPRVRVADNATVRLDLDNEPQPDVLLRIEPQAGGQSQVSDDDYLDGAPELIVEIAASSATYDLHDKLRVYRRNGVREYVVWRVHDRRIDWFVLADDEYRRLEPDTDGVLHSTVFPGLRLAAKALLAGNVATVLAELRRGLDTDEHAAFVKRMAAAS